DSHQQRREGRDERAGSGSELACDRQLHAAGFARPPGRDLRQLPRRRHGRRRRIRQRPAERAGYDRVAGRHLVPERARPAIHVARARRRHLRQRVLLGREQRHRDSVQQRVSGYDSLRAASGAHRGERAHRTDGGQRDLGGLPLGTQPDRRDRSAGRAPRLLRYRGEAARHAADLRHRGGLELPVRARHAMGARHIAAALAALAAALAGCTAVPDAAAPATAAPAAAGTGSAHAVVEVRRTPYGIAHIEAPDYASLAYGVAYAHAEDNVCQTADHLVTIRGERSAWFGPEARGLLGLRPLPNAVIDTFVRAHMDDAALARAQAALGDEAQQLMRGYVAGYNRFLEDHGANLPAECAGQPWVRPMTAADYLRMQELTMVQLGIALFADAMFGAAPPSGEATLEPPPDVAAAVRALERYGFDEPRLGSNGWAFGAEVTDNGRGVMLGNPHFPWEGVNRFWQMHLTIPGTLDVMGAAIGHSPVVQIGFNADVAWTHTVSTGKRFTLHELELVPGEPTAYVVDGERVAMQPGHVTYEVRTGDGTLVEREHTVWKTRYGPVIVMPDAGLNWSDTRAYALKDVNTRNLRAIEIWIGFNRADGVGAMRTVLGRLGVPWVNTIAADRHGSVLYADVAAVPDVDAEHLARCRPSDRAAALFDAAGLVVLDGSRSDCDWRRDPASPVPGLIPIERTPVAVRRDWVQNSNDSFWLSNPDIDWPAFSPLIGGVDQRQSLRTRSGLRTIRERLAGSDGIADHGRVGIGEVQAMLFANRNHAAEVVLDDLLALCADESGARRDACDVLAAWDRRAELDSRGAHLFREWWRV